MEIFFLKVSFPGICYLVQKCPNLELLDLENTSINDASICILVQALPKLTTLNLKVVLLQKNINSPLCLHIHVIYFCRVARN